MPTPTRAFHDVAARYGKVDPSDAEAVAPPEGSPA